MNFLIIYDGVVMFDTNDQPLAMTQFSAVRVGHPHAYLAEILIASNEPVAKLPIPGELDRAITAWNEMTDRVNIHIDKVKNRARLVPPYRKWKKAIGRREYLLEQLIPDVEAQPYIWTTIRFPWLLRVGADFNSDKIHARAYGKGGGGKQTEFQRQLNAEHAQYERDNPDWAEKVATLQDSIAKEPKNFNAVTRKRTDGNGA